MDECYCPRGRGYLERISRPLPDWMPSEDHYPVLKKDGGKLVRLAHRRCNQLAYGDDAGHVEGRGKWTAAKAQWHIDNPEESLSHAGNRAAAEAQWAAARHAPQVERETLSPEQ